MILGETHSSYNCLDRSALFRGYNAARALVRAGKLDAKRLNRGLALGQSRAALGYAATPGACDCPDALYRHMTCKHSIAASLRQLSKE